MKSFLQELGVYVRIKTGLPFPEAELAVFYDIPRNSGLQNLVGCKHMRFPLGRVSVVSCYLKKCSKRFFAATRGIKTVMS